MPHEYQYEYTHSYSMDIGHAVQDQSANELQADMQTLRGHSLAA